MTAPAPTILAAPVALPLAGDLDILAPGLTFDGKEYRARLLDISAVPRSGPYAGNAASIARRYW